MRRSLFVCMAIFLAGCGGQWGATSAAGQGNPPDPKVAELVEDLGSEDLEVSLSALSGLFYCDADRSAAVPAIVEKLKDKTFPDRTMAAKTLGSIGPKAREAVPALREALNEEGATAYLRLEAAEALWKIQQQPDDAVPALVELLTYRVEEKHSDWRVANDLAHIRETAARTLGQMKTAATAAVPTLEKVAQNDPGAGARRSAAAALRRIQQSETPDKADGDNDDK